MRASFLLSDSHRVRYTTGMMMYFAQGIPQGLLGIAIPVWLASQGIGAGENNPCAPDYFPRRSIPLIL